MITKDIFQTRLAIAMNEKGFTAFTLGQQSGVNYKTIGNYLAGKNLPGVEAAALMAKSLGVSIDWLCGRTDIKEVNQK